MGLRPKNINKILLSRRAIVSALEYGVKIKKSSQQIKREYSKELRVNFNNGYEIISLGVAKYTDKGDHYLLKLVKRDYNE